jgi:ubiquinone/menaquinone biosynthesis C-methylase UbiE
VVTIIKTIYKDEQCFNKIYKLRNEQDFSLIIKEGRIAIFEKGNKEFNDRYFLIGVGEEFHFNKDMIYYIKILVQSVSFVITDEVQLKEENRVAIKKLFSNVDDYYFGYEERYRTVYDNGADLWESENPNKSLIEIFKQYPKLFNGKVIDLGCGEGRDTIFLAQNKVDVQGIDISHSAINKAKEKYEVYADSKEIFHIGNVLYLNKFEDHTFDFAMNMGCLHMMNRNEDRLLHLNNVNRILKLNGYFLIDHCRTEWGKGFHTIENYEQIKNKLKNFNETQYIDRIIQVKGEKVKIPLRVLPYSEKSSTELINEISRSGFELVKSFHSNTESFGNSVLILFKKVKNISDFNVEFN